MTMFSEYLSLVDEDESWTDELESQDNCSERGYCGLVWLMQQYEQNILAVCHGGLLNYTMNNHPKVVLLDKRNVHADQERRCITKRFGNCEMREFRMSMVWNSGDFPTYYKNSDFERETEENSGPVVIMEEVEMNNSYFMTEDDRVNLL
jgi:hypothetical protein